MQNEIIQTIVQRVAGQKQKVATFIGMKDREDCIRIGWSRANINQGDKFNKKVGLRIATERLKATEMVPVPESLFYDALEFQERCQRYFRTDSSVCIKMR